MAEVYLVVTKVERWRDYNKSCNVYRICKDKETAIEAANYYIAHSLFTANVQHRGEKGFEYNSNPVGEDKYFACPFVLGTVTYYDDYVYSRSHFDDGHVKGTWSIHIEKWDIV